MVVGVDSTDLVEDRLEDEVDDSGEPDEETTIVLVSVAILELEDTRSEVELDEELGTLVAVVVDETEDLSELLVFITIVEVNATTELDDEVGVIIVLMVVVGDEAEELLLDSEDESSLLVVADTSLVERIVEVDKLMVEICLVDE